MDRLYQVLDWNMKYLRNGNISEEQKRLASDCLEHPDVTRYDLIGSEIC